jgi:hypothetical protein
VHPPDAALLGSLEREVELAAGRHLKRVYSCP